MEMETQVVVIGGGAAGLAAATWLGRYRRSTVVVDAGEHRNRWVELAHGYLGDDPVHPQDLLARARAQIRQYDDVEVCQGRVTRLAAETDNRLVAEVGGDRLVARRMVLATGVVDAFPRVEGFFEHYGADVFHCPGCDGYAARDRHVVVFGWDAHVVAFAIGLRNWAREVTVVTDGRPLVTDQAHHDALGRAGIPVVRDEAAALVGPRGSLRALRLREAGEIPCTMAFFSIAHRPVAELADQLGCRRTAEGYVDVDGECRTSVAGVYAAGDLTPGLQLVQAAAGQGAAAGVACALSLVDGG